MKLKFKIQYLKDKYYYPTRQYLKNIWKFRKELSNFYDWNYDLGLFRKSIELNKYAIEKYANEESTSRLKKVRKMERAIYILKCFEEDNFIELAEKELDYKMNIGDIWFKPCKEKKGYSVMKDDLDENQKQLNHSLIYKSKDIQNEMWKELWSIIQGQDYDTFNKENNFQEQFDGSGLLGWWD